MPAQRPPARRHYSTKTDGFLPCLLEQLVTKELLEGGAYVDPQNYQVQ